jgi:hypothetical protein
VRKRSSFSGYFTPFFAEIARKSSRRGENSSMIVNKLTILLHNIGATSKYLHNVIEQDHRFVKRLVKPGMGFFSFETAWRTLQGYEIMNMMRKGQVQGVDKGDIVGQIAWIAKVFGVAASMQREGHSMLILFLPHSCNTTLAVGFWVISGYHNLLHGLQY